MQADYSYEPAPSYDGYDLLEFYGMTDLITYCMDRNIVCNDFSTWIDPAADKSIYDLLQYNNKPTRISRALTLVYRGSENADVMSQFNKGNVSLFLPIFSFIRSTFMANVVSRSRVRVTTHEDYVSFGDVDHPVYAVIFFNGGAQLLFDYRLYAYQMENIAKLLKCKVYCLFGMNGFDIVSISESVANRMRSLPFRKYIYISESSGATMLMSILNFMISQNSCIYNRLMPSKCIMLYPGFLEAYNISPGRMAGMRRFGYDNPLFLEQQRKLYNIDIVNPNYLSQLHGFDITIVAAAKDPHIDYALVVQAHTNCEIIYTFNKHGCFSNLSKKQKSDHLITILYDILTKTVDNILNTA